ncbi:SAM-dependent methyltransferase [Saccharopolyspora indica]|uniref:N-6 DNA methylase n=1 Tax=Saccharopolyspora indica TaxID=1229659 RepID=UPI0022EB9721|nr:N-6 DNA methylase [Saccharopolyspora indica]MDA3647120.1 N-6 DNA methylase [Saccharopolyspora indica]
MSEDALVTAAEIARLADVGRAAVSNWRRRHADFPKPVSGAGSNPAFRLGEVRNWLHQQGKLAEVSPGKALWRAVDVHRDERDAIELVADIATYLRAPSSVALPAAIRAELDELIDEDAAGLIESLSTTLFERQQRQHLVTPRELANLMVALAGPVAATTVFDPACGPGNVLRAAAESGAAEVVGQEVAPALGTLAQTRLSGLASVHIRFGDTLRADAFPGLQADAVVCDPPFGYRDWGHEELGVDPRWHYGFPAKGEPELAWAQHCLAHVKPGGTVVIAMPSGAAVRRSGRLIRQELVRRGALQAVVALPAGVLMSTGIAIHLWVLRRPDADGIGPVLLVDTTHHRPARRGDVDWSAISNEILGAWHAFQQASQVDELPGRQRVVEPIELLGEEVDFTPAHYLPQPLRRVDLAEIENDRASLHQLMEAAGAHWPKLHESDPGTRSRTTIGDLAKAGALEILHQAGSLDLGKDGSGPLVLTSRDVVTGAEPELRSTDEAIALRPGDLVVPAAAAGDGMTALRVIDRAGWVLGPNMFLIRIDSDRLDAWFLAGQIRADGQAASSATASGIHRIDLRKVVIPALDIDQQRQLGTAFRHLIEWEASLKKAVEIGTQISRNLTEALADATVAPRL